MRTCLLLAFTLLLPAAVEGQTTGPMTAQSSDSTLLRLTRRIDAIQAQLDSLRAEVRALQPPAPVATAPIRAAPPTPFAPPARTKTSGCKSRRALPDAACTPGAVMTTNLDTICHTSTQARRNVTTGVRKAAYAAYGVLYPQPAGTIELDHLISLELGGDNTIENLWPEPATPKPGFHEKDLVEDELHRRVCSGQTTLAEAQRIISTDWLGFYQQNLQH
jgi:hypothetical protein